jgi:hypothetical protein
MGTMGEMNATILVPLIFAGSVRGGPENSIHTTPFPIRCVTAALGHGMQ